MLTHSFTEAIIQKIAQKNKTDTNVSPAIFNKNDC